MNSAKCQKKHKIANQFDMWRTLVQLQNMRMLGKSLTLLPLLLLLMLAAPICQSEAHPEGRIINGARVDITRHSYCVSVRYRRSSTSPYMHECAGVIYSDRGIVTAAQCLTDLTQDTKLIVVAGANSRNGSDGFVYPASQWIHHPQYTPITVDYDIGVIILDTALDLTEHGLRKIELRSERPATGREAIVIGWGYREEWGPSSTNLEQARVPIVSSDQCNGIYGVGEVTERMICAGDVAQGGTDACQGDTGGPLTVDEQLVGLVSWGRGCGRPGYPSVYTYAPSLKTWIEDTLKSAGAL